MSKPIRLKRYWRRFEDMSPMELWECPACGGWIEDDHPRDAGWVKDGTVESFATDARKCHRCDKLWTVRWDNTKGGHRNNPFVAIGGVGKGSEHIYTHFVELVPGPMPHSTDAKFIYGLYDEISLRDKGM